MAKITTTNQQQKSNSSVEAFLQNQTMGIEWEKFQLLHNNNNTKIPQDLQEEYKQRIQMLKRQNIERILQLNKEQDGTGHLGVINKNGKPFLDITFDDVNRDGRLEFISIAGNGVLSCKDFLTQENYKAINAAVTGFKEHITLKQQGSYGKNNEFTVVLSKIGQKCFEQLNLDAQKGLNQDIIHVTHSILSDFDLEKFKQHINTKQTEQRSEEIQTLQTKKAAIGHEWDGTIEISANQTKSYQ